MDIHALQQRMRADRERFELMRALLSNLLTLYAENETTEQLAQALQQRAGTPAKAVRWINAASKLTRANLDLVHNSIVIEAMENEIIKRGNDGQ